MWNHLVSQKAGQNDEEDKCNVRSAKRGERGREGEEKIKNNVKACNLKSSAQKVSQHRLQGLNLEATRGTTLVLRRLGKTTKRG